MPPHETDEPQPELTQLEREAIIDLLNVCIYADSYIAIKEDRFISQALLTIGWEKQVSFRAFEARSIAHAQEANQSGEARKQHLQRIAARLHSPFARETAMNLCRQLFAADGKTAATENTLLAEIRDTVK